MARTTSPRIFPGPSLQDTKGEPKMKTVQEILEYIDNTLAIDKGLNSRLRKRTFMHQQTLGHIAALENLKKWIQK